jgi:hypothetical protein
VTLFRVYLRGLAMVTLVACNTRQIAAGHMPGAVVVGFLISWLWWSNSSKARPEGQWAGLAYATGAACGTALGYVIAGWLGGKG